MTEVRFQILSDLHLEVPKSYDIFEITPKAPYLALLGDIGTVEDDDYLTFLQEQLSKFEVVFLLLGNHEPYHSNWKTTKTKIQQFEKEARIRCENDKHLGQLVFLDQTRFDVSPDITILGCTLFSDIGPAQANDVSFGLNDFYYIEDWTVEQHTETHKKEIAWLNGEVRNLAETEPHRSVVVLTHYSPTIIEAAVDPAHAQSKISSGFATDLSTEDCWTSSNVRLWAFGHTHYNCQYKDAATVKRVVTNQRGYAFRQAPGFDEQRTFIV